jgi:hypothetical protein
VRSHIFSPLPLPGCKLGRDDHIYCEQIDGDKNSPKKINSIPFKLDQLGPDVEDGNSESIEGMKKNAENHKDLEPPGFINGIDCSPPGA